MTPYMGRVKLAAAIVVVALALVVFVQNSQPVSFTFLLFKPVYVSKTLLILVSAVVGAVCTLLVQFAWRRRKRPAAAAVPAPAPPLTPTAASGRQTGGAGTPSPPSSMTRTALPDSMVPTSGGEISRASPRDSERNTCEPCAPVGRTW